MSPPPKDKLLALAERCEAATGPSFELFAEAFGAINGGRSALGEKWSAFCALIEADAWLDAAITLVPEGCGIYTRWSLKGGETRTADAILTREASQAIGQHGHYVAENVNVEVLGCKTLPLALCAAALRSRSQTTEPGEG
jgi:hypothetical protein